MARIVLASDGDAAVSLASVLVEEGIAITPCDTMYGIHGIVPATERKIRDIKGRHENKPLIVLQPSVESVLEIAADDLPESLLALWPGALTLILRTENGAVGYRVPADSFILGVLEKTGPLYSTSVNLSGEPPLWRAKDIKNIFADKVDIIIDGGDLPGKIPSTILDIRKKPYTILRQGAVELPEEIRGVCT